MVALISISKAEQLKIHFWGFFHQGGSPDDILEILTYLEKSDYISSSTKKSAITVLDEAKQKYSEITRTSFTAKISASITPKVKGIIDFVAHIAIGDNEKTAACCRTLLSDRTLTIEEMYHMMQHEAVYCGFPVEMNGRAVLSSMAPT